MDDASFILGGICVYIVMRLIAEFHYRLTPALDLNKIPEIIEFISRSKNITLESERLWPLIHMVETQGIGISDEILKSNGGLVDFAVEAYFPQWSPPRIWLVEGCRQNMLVHALVHYIQFEYEPGLLNEREKEKEAWAITKQYLKHAHPLNYWILTIPFGIYCWWTSTPY